jgi:superfamily II DNA or RNA helicase
MVLVPCDNKLKRLLRIYPKNTMTPFPKPVINFRNSTDGNMIIPRYFAHEHIGKKPQRPCIKNRDSIQFKGTLRDYQVKIVDDIMKSINDFPGVILSLYTGAGKTLIALYVMSLLKVKTLIVVNKNMLLEQFQDRIKQFIPDAKVGIIQGGKFDIKGCDVVIAMLQTVARDRLESKHFRSFGFVVYDEVHNVNTDIFSKALFKIPAHYRLGLSATPKRTDGLEIVSIAHIGPIKEYTSQVQLRPDVHFYEPKGVGSVDVIPELPDGKTNLPGLINKVLFNKDTINYIVKIIKKYSTNDRQILVLVDRVSVCHQIAKSLGCGDDRVYAGKNRPREAIETDGIIIGTYSQLKEGVDVPRMDTIIFASPRSSVIQAVGRITRRVNKNNPVVVDIVYDNPVMKTQKYRRIQDYNKLKCIRSRHDLEEPKQPEDCEEVENPRQSIYHFLSEREHDQ